ncbi:hypothetical protein PTSG_12372 [Salpingoeca rosetta]|uniref:Uncharacterized protein n=1 Tax=Salpingoeca rosetta (strain ATCC 50818 / BSB-021) TaxID=946362 RepID=F2UDA8_SALR5|nr:uncharacterized protein PTSG_12372 [Salpingoeca rosetta]EGD74603.1 hypothetical protein PTSG_12372 [Salpingoeca rosetta]|eukprot:XP_004992860.1 hypothetical protein PTSG_12372 [Salpingoeca rosetta]
MFSTFSYRFPSTLHSTSPCFLFLFVSPLPVTVTFLSSRIFSVVSRSSDAPTSFSSLATAIAMPPAAITTTTTTTTTTHSSTALTCHHDASTHCPHHCHHPPPPPPPPPPSPPEDVMTACLGHAHLLSQSPTRWAFDDCFRFRSPKERVSPLVS